MVLVSTSYYLRLITLMGVKGGDYMCLSNSNVFLHRKLIIIIAQTLCDIILKVCGLSSLPKLHMHAKTCVLPIAKSICCCGYMYVTSNYITCHTGYIYI